MKRKCMLCGRKATCRCRKCGAGYCEFHASLNLVRGLLGCRLRCANCGYVGKAQGP